MDTNQDRLNRLAEMSGDSDMGRAPRYDVPILKFNGNTGAFRKIEIRAGEKTETPIDGQVEIVILKKRKSLSSFSPLQSYFTTEYSSPNDRVSLYKKVDNTVVFEKQGTPAELRQEYQALRTKEILYCAYNGLVHKLEVKGGSLGGLYELFDSLKDADKHTFQVKINITSSPEKNESGFAYQKMVFNVSGDSDLDKVEPLMVEVSQALAKIDEYYMKRSFQNNTSGYSEAKSYDELAKREFEALTAEDEPSGGIPF